MSALVLSLTARLVLSLTEDSSYREPNQGVSYCDSCEIQTLNYANTESFRFLLTQNRIVDKSRGSRWRPSRRRQKHLQPRISQ